MNRPEWSICDQLFSPAFYPIALIEFPAGKILKVLSVWPGNCGYEVLANLVGCPMESTLSRKQAMEITSVISIVAKSENAKDRRLAIQRSWSIEERNDRRRNAIDSQLRLVALLSMGRRKTAWSQKSLELAC